MALYVVLAAFLRVFGTGLQVSLRNGCCPQSFLAGASMVLGNIAALRHQQSA